MMSIEHWLQYLKEIAGCIKAPVRYLRTMLLLVITSCLLLIPVSVYAINYDVKISTLAHTNVTGCASIKLTGTSGTVTLHGLDDSPHDYDFVGEETRSFSEDDVGHISEIQVNHDSYDGCIREHWNISYIEITKDGRSYLFGGPTESKHIGWLDMQSNSPKASGPEVLGGDTWYEYKIVKQHQPEARNVAITGTLAVGQTLTGSYEYYDEDGDQAENPGYQWYYATDLSCSSKTAITGANALTYNLTQSSAGYYICFGVTPKAHSGLPEGEEVITTQGPLAKLSQSITFGALTDKTYGDSSFTVGATTDSGLSVSYSTSGNCSNSGSSVSLTGAGSCTVTASQSGNASYEAASSKSQTFSIAKKQAYITFNPPTKTFGDSPFNLSATGDANKSVWYTGGNSVCSVNHSGNVTIHNAGSCSVTANQDADDNYIGAAPVTKAIFIRRQPQTIQFSSVSTKKYLDDPFTLSATGGKSGNPVVLESKTPDVCSGSGENAIEITINTAGTCTIEATQAGASNYEAAIPTPKNIIIQKLPQEITDYIVPSEPKTYGDASFTVSAVTANANNSGNPVTFSSSTPTICTVSGDNGEEVSIIGAGTCTIVADQASNVNYSPAPSANQSVSIAKLDVIAIADEKTRGYGEAVNPPFTFSYTGLVNGDDASVIDTHPNGLTVADINSLVDTYEITCSGGSDNNYTITDCTTGLLNVIRAETGSVMLSDDPDPSPPPQNVTFEFKVTPVSGNEPTGTVTVTDGQNSCSAELQTGDSGRGSCVMTLGGVGFKDITATYAGDDRFNGSASAAIEHEIDNVGVVITELDDKTTLHEDGSITDTYTLELTTVPLAPVIVTVTPEIQVALNGQSVGVAVALTFTDVTPQTVTVTANDDSILEGTHTSTIMHTATSDDADYDEIAIASTTVHIYDNDPGIVIKQTGKSTDVIEGGLTDVYSVMLGTQPTDSVTVAISADAESTVSPTTLTFNADTTALEPQIVTVKAVDDRAADGLKISVISHTSTSSDSDYETESVAFVVDGEQTAEIKAKVGDNDVPGVSIIGHSLSVSESGAKDRYSVVLNTMPQNTSEVTIKLSNSSSSSCLVEPSTLTFTTGNWDITQVVTVTAIDDDVYESSESCTIRHSSSGGDYEGLSIADIEVQVRDNDPKPLKYLTIKFTENGQGTIFANNQSCHSDKEECRLEFVHNQQIELLAYPDSGFAFNKWTGDLLCKKETFSLYTDISCTADFKLGKRYLIVESLRGTVYSTPSGIYNCAFLQGRCSASFEGGSEIKLTSKAEEGWISVGWEGACDEEGRIKALTRNMSCTALYEPEPARFDSLEVFDYQNEIILDGSGLDFDTQVGHPITRKVALRNTHQISRMHLTDLVLPKGFSPVSAFPSRLEPNQTAIFQIQLDALVEDIYEGLWSFKVGEDMAAYPLIGVVHETCPKASDITILYVKQGATIGDGGGCNWDYPFKDLQTALIAIANNKYPKVKEVWVTSGTYKPTTDTDRTKSFVLTEGVKIYGGFLGTEEQRKERNEHLYVCPAPTILSGDIGVEDEASDNSYHVVSAYGVSSETGLYDVTITGGNANGGGRTREGRMRSDSDQERFSKGGGMYNDNASLTIDDVLFAGNAAILGGGMFNGNGSRPIVRNAAFANNAAVNGGGMVNDNSSPAIVNVAFTQNQASNAGGGMLNQNNANPLLNNVVMNSNAAKIGGGLVNDNSSPSITTAYFTHNTAIEGGAMVNRNHSTPMIDNSFLSDNTATASGGAMLNINSQPILMRSVISGNVAPVGSGIANQDGSQMLMSRSAVEENRDATGTITTQIVDDSTSQTTVNNSNVQGGWVGAGTNNSDKVLNIDNILALKLPLDDIRASTNNSADFNFAGVAYEPEPNDVDTAEKGATEIDAASKGNQAESVGPVLASDIQVGSALTEAEEAILTQLKEEPACPETTVLYVNSNVETSGTGCSWDSPLTHLQVALAATATSAFPDVQEIWLAKGLYKPTTGVDRQAAFQLIKGIAIYGGFAGTETQREERTPHVNLTMLSGDIGILGDNSDNSYHVVTGIATNATAILSDVVISGGNANEGMSCPHACGGGLYNDQGSPTLTNLLVKDNSAIYGGGLFNGNGSQPLIEDSIFHNNAAMDGGGILNDFSRPTISGVFLRDNTASHQGGGMMNRNQAHARLSHVNLSSNTAAWGGGLSNDNSNPVITQSLLSDNQADYGGGMVNLNHSAPLLGHVILSGNAAINVGGAIFNRNSRLLISQTTISENAAPTGSGLINDNSQTVINNSILWDNQYHLAANDITPQILEVLDDLGTPSTGVTTVNYSIIQGGWQGLGEHNQDKNPLFVKPVVDHIATHTPDGDFHLRPDSPGIDAGNNDLIPIDCNEVECLGQLDFHDETRLVDGNGDGFAQVDLGAYEFQDLFQKDSQQESEPSELSTTMAPPAALFEICFTTEREHFSGVCHANGQVIPYTEIEADSSLSGAIVDKPLLNKGLVSNVTVTELGVITGGRLSGYIKNDGIITDFEFVGASIQGSHKASKIVGTLGGKITNRSQIGGFFQDVNLAPNTAITGGLLKGRIRGDTEGPATLASLTIDSDSQVSHVILQKDVILQENVTLTDVVLQGLEVNQAILAGRIQNTNAGSFKNVQLAAHAHISGGQLLGRVVGQADAPALLEFVTIQADTYLNYVIIGKNVELAEGVRFGEDVWFESTMTKGIGVDKYGKPVLNKTAAFGIATRLSEPFTVFADESLDILTTITVDAEHQGQSGELLMVQRFNAQDFEMRIGENWRDWDGQINHLQAMTVVAALPESVNIPIAINPAIGEYWLYFGYRLENGTIIHNGQKPLHLKVVDR